MLDSCFRSFYQTFLINTLLPRMLHYKLSPHLFTLAALLFGIGTLPALYFSQPFAAITLILLSGFFDTLDGSIARAQNQTTAQGAVYDIAADRVVESSIIIGLYFVDPETRGLPCLLMMASAFICVTTFLVVGIFLKNKGEKGFHYSIGIIERTEAFLFFVAMILFPSLFFVFASAFSILVSLTALVRVWEFSHIPNILEKPSLTICSHEKNR